MCAKSVNTSRLPDIFLALSQASQQNVISNLTVLPANSIDFWPRISCNYFVGNSLP